MGSYSKDLRMRVVAAYKECKNYSAAAKRFSVSSQWVQKMVRFEEKTGSLDTQYQKNGRPPIITEH